MVDQQRGTPESTRRIGVSPHAAALFSSSQIRRSAPARRRRLSPRKPGMSANTTVQTVALRRGIQTTCTCVMSLFAGARAAGPRGVASASFGPGWTEAAEGWPIRPRYMMASNVTIATQ